MIDGELSQSDYLKFTAFLEKQCGIVLVFSYNAIFGRWQEGSFVMVNNRFNWW